MVNFVRSDIWLILLWLILLDYIQMVNFVRLDIYKWLILLSLKETCRPTNY